MDAALASLDRGVRALFTDPSAIIGASSSHPLCECILLQAPPPDWRYLQRFPVLKRHLLVEFRSVAIEMAKTPQTPRKRKKRSIIQQSEDSIEYKALCFTSLCQKLAQCKLLTVGEAELMETLVNLESLEILRRAIGARLLPLRLRMLLLGFALRVQRTKCLEAEIQSWIQEVCEKMLEEVLETTANGGSSEPPTKRARTRSGDKKMNDGEEVKKCCGFCRDGASVESLRSKLGGWDFLVECTQQIAKVLEKAGENYATNQAMVALSAFWESLPITGLTTKVKKSRRRKRIEISMSSVEDVEPSVVEYERICRTEVASEEFGDKANAFQKMWMNIWEREYKNTVKVKHITLADVICHCSKADVFVSIVLLPEMKAKTMHLPGFRVVKDMIRSLFVDISGVITAFAHAWNTARADCSETSPRMPTSRGTGPSSAKRILQLYLSELLDSPSICHEAEPSAMDKSPTLSRSSPLELLYFLYEIFSDPIVKGQYNSNFSMYWDVVMAQQGNTPLMKELTHDGITWWFFLEKCVLDFDAREKLTMRHCDHFLHAFKCYCRGIVYGVVASGGEIISSGGAIQRQLVRMESDRSAVRHVLSQMMIVFGEDWISDLITQLVRASTSLRSTSEANQRGVKSLLFPALISYMKSTSKSSPKKRTSGQQQYTAIIHVVNAMLKESEPTSLYLVSLMRFCEAWDVYQSTHMKEPPTRTKRWGFRAMVELDILPELLECYERDDVVHQEASESLVFAAEVLQNAPNCPQTLETRLYNVLSAVKAGTEHSKTFESESLEGFEFDGQLISHSSNALQRLLRAVKFADLAQTRQLMEQMKDSVGTLSELRQQLERWFSFVEMHGTAFAGKESRLELSVLCTRLIRWFPDEFERLRYLLMTPLDAHLVFALKAFVKEAGRSNSKERQSLVNSTTRSALPAAVRVEMALHLYLSAAVFPDLETLTTLLTKAIVKCRSPGAFDHLAKVAQKNSRMLLPEAVVKTLNSPLRGLALSVSALTPPDEDDDDEHVKNHARHAKAIIYQRNTLRFVAVSATIFEGGISWSTLLFDEKSAVTWLPHFFEYILKTEFGEGALRADLVLANLEGLTQKVGEGEKALREAYWLTALLNTALVACSSRSAGAYVDVEEGIKARVRVITGKLLQLLSIASPTTTTTTACEGDDTPLFEGEILGLLKMSKSSRLAIQEHGARWIQERLINEKSVGALRLSVSDVWDAEMEEPHTRVESSFQLFMPFSCWLAGALVYSQSFLEELSPTMRRWERTFTSYVIDLYLHLEFENVTCNLLKVWLTTWVTSNIVRSQEDMQLLALLPSQVALFRRLGLTPSRGASPERIRDSASNWQLIFVAVNLTLDHHTAENTSVFEQATELVVSTLTTLELVELSTSSDFVQFSHVQEIDPFFEELDKFLSRPQLRICSTDQVCCLLQYLLELLVCWYACKISVTFEMESQLFLQRVKKVLQGNFSSTTFADDSRDQQQFSVDSAEMDAFFQYWADEMLLKYDYVDRHRCVNILEIIQTSLKVGNDEQ